MYVLSAVAAAPRNPAAPGAVGAAVNECVAHGHPGVGHPHRGRVPQLVVAGRRGRLDCAVEGVQPVVPLLQKSEH